MLVSIGRTSEDVSDGEALFDKVHSFAIKQVRAIEHENKVLMYCIEDGKFNVEPLMFDSHLEAHGYLTEIRNNSENLS